MTNEIELLLKFHAFQITVRDREYGVDADEPYIYIHE